MLKALALQGALIVTSAVAAWLGWGLDWGAWIWGGIVAWINAVLLVWRWRKGLHDYHCDGPRHLKSFRRSLTERFFVVGLLLAAGFGYGLLEPAFSPLPMLLGFIVGLLAWGIALAVLNTE
jgi:hypothetical protein